MLIAREMNKYDNARGARVTDALLNYETVKCFNNEELERQRLEQAIIDYQNVEYKLMASLNGLNVLQSIIIFSGLIAGLVVCTKVHTLPLHGSPAHRLMSAYVSRLRYFCWDLLAEASRLLACISGRMSALTCKGSQF